MQNAISAFQAECRRRGLDHYLAVFDRHVLSAQDYGDPSYRDTAQALNISERDVDNYLYGSRELFATIVRRLIRQTVASAADVDRELVDFRRWFG